MIILTSKQRAVLERLGELGKAVTLTWLASSMGYSAPAGLTSHIQVLEENGFITCTRKSIFKYAEISKRGKAFLSNGNTGLPPLNEEPIEPPPDPVAPEASPVQIPDDIETDPVPTEPPPIRDIAPAPARRFVEPTAGKRELNESIQNIVRALLVEQARPLVQRLDAFNARLNALEKERAANKPAAAPTTDGNSRLDGLLRARWLYLNTGDRDTFLAALTAEISELMPKPDNLRRSG